MEDKIDNHHQEAPFKTLEGKTTLLDTKSGHLNNTDRAAKCRLGNEWKRLAGDNFAYFMVFIKNPIDGAYSLDRAKELIGKM